MALAFFCGLVQIKGKGAKVSLTSALWKFALGSEVSSCARPKFDIGRAELGRNEQKWRSFSLN